MKRKLMFAIVIVSVICYSMISCEKEFEESNSDQPVNEVKVETGSDKPLETDTNVAGNDGDTNTETQETLTHITQLTRNYMIEDCSDGFLSINLLDNKLNSTIGWAITDPYGYVMYAETDQPEKLLMLAQREFPVNNGIVVRNENGIKLVNIENGSSKVFENANKLTDCSDNGYLWFRTSLKTLQNVEYEYSCVDKNFNIVYSIKEEYCNKYILEPDTGLCIMINKEKNDAVVLDHGQELSADLSEYRDKLKHFFENHTGNVSNIVDIFDGMIRMIDSVNNTTYYYNLDSGEYLYLNKIEAFNGANSYSGGPCSEGMITVNLYSAKTGRFGAVIDKSGNVVFGPSDTVNFMISNNKDDPAFNNGMCSATDRNYRCFYIDTTGENVLNIQGVQITNFDSGFASVHYGTYKTIIDMSGAVIFSD